MSRLDRAFALARKGIIVTMEDTDNQYWEINWLLEREDWGEPLIPANMGFPRRFYCFNPKTRLKWTF